MTAKSPYLVHMQRIPATADCPNTSAFRITFDPVSERYALERAIRDALGNESWVRVGFPHTRIVDFASQYLMSLVTPNDE